MLNLFDHLKHILTVQDNDYFRYLLEEDMKTFDLFMINRYLSQVIEYLPLISAIENYSDILTKEQYYHLLISMIPKTHRSYIPYTKAAKKPKCDPDILRVLHYEYVTSMKQSREIYNILIKDDAGREVLQQMLMKYGVENKVLKRNGLQYL